jgi:hypothetical protein
MTRTEIVMLMSDGMGGLEPIPEAPKRKRTSASAKKAGSSFERQVADYLALTVDDRIDRRVKNGTKDRGDIGGVRINGRRVVLECKNTAKASLGTWANEAEIERGNDDALAGVVIHKRHGKGQPADQWVTLTLADFAAILTGNRDHITELEEA